MAVGTEAGMDDAKRFETFGVKYGPEASGPLGGDHRNGDFGFVLFEGEPLTLGVDPDGIHGDGEEAALAGWIKRIGKAGGIVPLMIEGDSGAAGVADNVHAGAIGEEAATGKEAFGKGDFLWPGEADKVEIGAEATGADEDVSSFEGELPVPAKVFEMDTGDAAVFGG